MSSTNTHETEQLIIKLLKKLERKGKNIQCFLWKLMDEFEDEQIDEKNDENKSNMNNNIKITLLYDETVRNVCKVGHFIQPNDEKHLSIEPCIICGHTNNNKQNKIKPNSQQILQFLENYNTNQMPFGPHQNQQQEIKAWITNGNAKKWPLHYAAITGDVAKINALSKNNNIEMDEKMTDWADKPPITCATRYGQLESVIELIKLGANPTQPPDKKNQTPYSQGSYRKHKAIIVFFADYIKYLYNFDINNNTNLACFRCYYWDFHFNKHMLNGTMSKYVYCVGCTLENVRKVQKIQADNLVVERRIIKTIKQNPSISVDTLCQMKDVISLHSILKEIIVSGGKHAYSLWLLDIDNFKAINTQLTHAIADTKIQLLGQVLKKLEPITWRQWHVNGYSGLYKIWAFRQGGDEFAMVVRCNAQSIHILQKLYDRLRNSIHEITLENMDSMKHVTVSIGVCMGDGAADYEEMMKKADEAAETVKKSGKNGIAIYHPKSKQIYKNFNAIE